jgi:hypothetical protein
MRFWNDWRNQARFGLSADARSLLGNPLDDGVGL